MHQIRYFLAVSETLNLTKAAKQCNVAQPSLARAIKALETELGGELLRRERALSHLTELGLRMLPMLRQSYETAVTAKQVAASMKRGESAPLSFAVPHTVALAPFIPALRELSGAFPRLQLKLHRGTGPEIAEFLKTGTAELAIASSIGDSWARFDCFPLFDEPFDLVVSQTHRLAGRNRVQFKDLASETLLTVTGCEMLEEIKSRFTANGIVDMATHQVATQEGLLALLKADFGLAIIPIGTVETNGLCRVPLEQLDVTRRVSAYTVAGRRREIACATLLNLLRAANWEFGIAMDQQRKVS